MAHVTLSGGTRRLASMALAVTCVVGSTACLPGGSEACDALNDVPDGLTEIRSQGGEHVERATWFAVLTTGVIAADPDARAPMAVAVRNDRDGYERILDTVDGLDTELELLHRAASDADLGSTMSSAPDTLAAVNALAAYVGEECDG